MTSFAANLPTALSRTDRNYLGIAARAALAPSSAGYRLGAVAVRGGRVLGLGSNKLRNHRHAQAPRSAWSIHAEAACLRRILDARGATLYVARVAATGDTRLARPCPACWNLAFDAGISKIVYTTNSGASVERLHRKGR